jgi:hypothetical protein
LSSQSNKNDENLCLACCGGESEYFMDAAENQISLEDLMEYLIRHFEKLQKQHENEKIHVKKLFEKNSESSVIIHIH